MSDDDFDDIALLLYLRRRKKRRENAMVQRRKARWWVHPTIELRPEYGAFANIVQELRSDPERFYNFHRMLPDQFDELLDLIKPKIRKCWLTREPISPGLRLSLTLRYVWQIF